MNGREMLQLVAFQTVGPVWKSLRRKLIVKDQKVNSFDEIWYKGPPFFATLKIKQIWT